MMATSASTCFNSVRHSKITQGLMNQLTINNKKLFSSTTKPTQFLNTSFILNPRTTTPTTLTTTRRYFATGPYVNNNHKDIKIDAPKSKKIKEPMTKQDINTYMGILAFSTFISFCCIDLDLENGRVTVGDVFPYESVEACIDGVNRACHKYLGIGWKPLPKPVVLLDDKGRPLPSAEQAAQFKVSPHAGGIDTI